MRTQFKPGFTEEVRLTGEMQQEVVSRPVIDLPIPEITTSLFYSCWSFVMNLTFGLIGLAAMLIILPVIALIISIDSPGPVFYIQERLGRKGKPFRMYKFRSMAVIAEDTKNISLTIINDPRVTRVGHFLRTCHLDELPQVINILRGEMSLVGPRPELPECSATLECLIPTYCHRLEVKPGLTGWTQVMYHYGNGDVEDEEIKLGLDLYYIKNQSVWLDIETILRTIQEVVFGYGR